MLRMKHPQALIPLFLTEMWERFGFYIVQGLLIIFMVQHLHFSDQKSFLIMGEFSALVYVSPLLGGFLADKIIGYRNSILLGAILLGVGYAVLTTLQKPLLLWGLACLVMGNGFLKPNISAYLGEFYKPQDPRRDSGFTIFYMGINTGILLSTLSSGFIQRFFGWNMTFFAATIGMIIAIITFRLGYNTFADYGSPIRKSTYSSSLIRFLSNKVLLSTVIVVGILTTYLLLKLPGLGETLLNIAGILLLFGLIISAFRYHKHERNRMLLLIILITASIFFWAIFFQMFFSVNLFVDRAVHKVVHGFNIPAVAFLSLEPIFIVIMALPLARLWQKFNYDAAHRPAISIKFAFGIISLAAAMLILVASTHFTLLNEKIHIGWLVGFYLLLTFGEMLLSPIGLSMVTELAPKNVTGLMMGVWFLALGFGGELAGHLAMIASIPTNITRLTDITAIYGHAFLVYAVIAILVGITLLALTPWLKKLQNTPVEENNT